MKRLLLVWLFGLVACFAYSQAAPDCGGPPADIPPAESCPEACIYCDFAGYMGNSGGYAGNGTPPGGFCSQIQNDQWLGFIAGASSATFSIIPSNCANGNGVQVALYESCNTAPLGCNGGCAGCGNQTTTISVSMIVGTNYFLLIDGFAGDECDLTISVSPATAVQAPPVGAMSPFQGPALVCPGATVPYVVPNVTGAGTYTWSSTTAGVTFNGQFSPAEFDAPDGRFVDISFPTGVTGNVEICVEANNSCNTGPKRCRIINVQPIAPTNFPPTVVCYDDAPYTLPWGDEVSAVGTNTYKTTLTSYLGCDSVVQQRVTIKPPIQTNIGPKYVCAGGSINVCGNIINESGPIQETCESFQGCDSLVTGFLTILEPIANIIGGGTLSCATSSIVLNSELSSGNTIKIWRRLPGTVIGNGNSVTVAQPGTYTLTSTISLGGVTCVQADTIVIDGNTTPPLAGAVANGFIGCGNGTTTVSGTSNVPNSTYAWGAPLNSNQQTTVVTASGTYTVTVTSPLNGCSSTATVQVTGNTTPPSATATGGTLSCAVTSIGISATTNASNPAYVWNGPGGFNSTLANPNVAAAGTYTVTITNLANSCSTTATTTVVLDNAAPTAATVVDGAISCPTPVLSIGTTTNAVGPTYQWGPAPFSSNSPNPSVNAAGTYTVTITATGGNGCTATASATITGNTTPPNATAVGDTVNCATPSIVLNGGSTTPSVTYAWAGPNNYTASTSDPTANTPGVYTLTVTGTNSCTTTATATIEGDFVTPTGVTASGGVINCGTVSTTITSSSTSNPVTFEWEGPGNFHATTATATAVNTGTYTIIVTSLNGCTATATAEVVQDANVPDATADGGVLNCINNSILLNGGSTTPGVTLAWTGPNGFVSTDEDPLVTVDGIYTLTVTNPLNGCSKLAEANVELDIDEPGAQALAATLTCANPTQSLTGSSPTASVTWSWAGPDPSFPSILQNPTASTAGFYTLTVSSTGNGCTSTATVEMLEDKANPVASSSTGTLTCDVTSLILNGATTLPGTFKWVGPNNFNSTLAAPTVTVPGDYTLEITAANGCTGTAVVPVQQDIAAPGVTATGGVLSCTFPQIDLASASQTAGVTYAWTGPNPFTSQQQNPIVSVNGTYTVTVTNGINGCTSTAEANVTLDKIPPVATASSPDILTCATTSVVIQASAVNASSPVTLLEWLGPNFTSNDEDPSVTASGVYVLTATSANGCSSTTTVEVKEDKASPDVSAKSGTITCFFPNIKFDGASTTTGATFEWAGPNFTSNEEDPTLSVPGVYTLTVTGPNGCTSTATTELLENTTPPGATTVSSNNLDCDDLSSILTGGPATDVSYRWVGPNGFDKTGSTQTIMEPGTYTLTTTSDLNGCTSTSSVEVTQDIVAPGATALGDTLNCISGQATLTGNSQTAGVKYEWKGPGNYVSQLSTPNDVTNPGLYTLTVTGLNGCTSTATATVAQNTGTPVVSLSNPATLTCAVTDVSITGTISTSGATGVWAGPGGFSSTDPTVQVSVPGTYTFTVTNPANGCKAAPSVTVNQNIQAPQAVTATGGEIDCVSPIITIKGSTTTTNVDYNWTGPGGYTSTLQNPDNITNPGIYTLVVTNKANGCTASATANVTQDPTVPTIDVTTQVLTCKQPSVVLQATTDNPTGVTWDWTGPGITAANKTVEDPSVTVPGDYVVVVTANSSGCKSNFTINVTEDKALPGATAAGDTLNCLVSSITINSNTPTANVEYLWGGPGAFTSTLQNPSVTLIGTYTVTITAQNGCTSTATAVVSPDKDAPIISAQGGTLTCAITSIQLEASSNLPVQWLWSGPGGFTSTQQSPAVTLAGGYVVQATAANGCSVSTGINVIDNTTPPSINTGVPNELNCTTTQVNLSATVAGTGPFTYQWGTTNGTIVSGGTSPAPTVSQAGQYIITVTNTLNGCTSSAQVTVVTDPATPSGVATAKRNVSCFGDTNGAILIDSVQGGTAPFLYSLDNSPFSAQTNFTSLPPGPHLLMIQDANGCEFETTIEILEPEELLVDLGRDTTIHLGDSILLELGNIVNFPDRVDQLLVKPADIFTGKALYPVHSFRYTATVVDSNGCKAVDDRVVIVDKTRLVYIPNVLYPESANGNELLRISVGQDVEMIKAFQIYDRWGSAVYEKRNFLPENPNNDGWDGRVKGDRATPAVFVYYAEILFKDGEVEIFKGDITVYR